jgi:hypothetical protein
MPSSDEAFGLAGEQRELMPGILQQQQLPGGPTPEELEKDFERALHTKHVRLKKVTIRTFDLSNDEQREEYCKLCVRLYNDASTGQTVIQQHERKFIEQPTPRYIVHIEWWEYALLVDGKELTPQEFGAWRKLQSKDKGATDDGA